jgi:hypothetical protein
MNNHTGFFVYYHQVFIFIKYMNGDILREDLIFTVGIGEYYSDQVARLNPVIGFYCVTIYQNIPCLNGNLYFISRNIFDPVEQEFINSQQPLALIGYYAVMFI